MALRFGSDRRAAVGVVLVTLHVVYALIVLAAFDTPKRSLLSPGYRRRTSEAQLLLVAIQMWTSLDPRWLLQRLSSTRE